jgi:hypothetical protein
MSIGNNDIDRNLHRELMLITGKDKDMSIRNLLKSELEFGKTNHMFICYHSDTSRTFAKIIQSSLKAAFGNSLAKIGKKTYTEFVYVLYFRSHTQILLKTRLVYLAIAILNEVQNYPKL